MVLAACKPRICKKLVSPDWLYNLINGETSEKEPTKDYKIFEVSWGKPLEYDKGHIPGAIHLDTNLFEREPLWNKVPDEELEEVLVRHGITRDTTVILYESETAAAFRVAVIMMYAGVRDVKVLDGGLKAWKAAGFPLEVRPNCPVPVKSFGVKVPAFPEFLVDTQEVKKLLSEENALLVCVRSWAEYIGETSGYAYIKAKGRIKGAVWGHGGSDAYHMEDYRNPDNTMKDLHEIERNWRQWGITPEKRVVFSCGTGWRASEAFFAAYLMGWENIAVYDGGWIEWSMDESNPIETGPPSRNPLEDPIKCKI
ncbi:Rhodanese domain protein [Thermovirga lienii DSM 17291]|jgi:thiosulfate/3-mercaptopyruvate sulfurtransferase|uniref:Rhodanese domain protein n=1 Tax=Thermovirga lienii (strain ATCC BAA-1197 / DSM 17291 / Cas60314) TaxID=580340 RepID=G7V6R9_THELD|nr:Rhodanese domain protein [Thermovirga lienii DSM 17291]